MTTVYVAIYDTRHGLGVRVFSTEQKALDWRNELAALGWEDEFDEEVPPEDPNQLADRYFERMAEADHGEYFSIDEREVDE